jgi:hypothetical protein
LFLFVGIPLFTGFILIFYLKIDEAYQVLFQREPYKGESLVRRVEEKQSNPRGVT